jgi:hypothetical protein
LTGDFGEPSKQRKNYGLRTAFLVSLSVHKAYFEHFRDPNMVWVMIRALGWYYLKPWIALTISCAFTVFIPIYLIKNLINFGNSP